MLPYLTLVGWVLIGVTMVRVSSTMTRNDLFHETNRLYNNGVLMASILVWPLLFGAVVGWDQLTGKMWFPFLWPTVLMVYGLTQTTTKEAPETAFQRHNEIKSNANGLIGAAFALGTLLAVIQGNQSKQGAQVLMISLLMCIAFLLPSPLSSPDSYTAHVIRTTQQNFFHMALGLFMAGIFISWNT